MNTVEGDAEFVVVANRLPIEPVYEDMNPDLEIIGWRTSPGGLVSALDPVLRGRKSVWVGAGELAPDQVGAFEQTRLDAVSIPAADYLDYYSGFANTAIWPLYHAAVITSEFHRPQFDAYSRVNSLFADRVAELAAQGGTVWVHDYQLQLVPQALRSLRPDVLIGFFLHIPFRQQSCLLKCLGENKFFAECSDLISSGFRRTKTHPISSMLASEYLVFEFKMEKY